MSISSRGIRLRYHAAFVLCLLAVFSGCADDAPDLPDGLYARMETNRGTIILQLEPEKMPLTTMSFVGLVEGTISHNRSDATRFYDGLTFHRVEPGFVVQGGDPNGDGTGGPGYRFPTEIDDTLTHDGPGVLAMANSGPDTNGSQFYITLGAAPWLDGSYNVFGHVVSGMDVVTSIEVGDKIRLVEIARVGEEAEQYQASDAEFQRLLSEVADARAAQLENEKREQLQQALTEYPGAEELDGSGLYLDQVSPGTGEPPVRGETVAVHLVWKLLDGTQLDSTRDRGQPYEFTYLVDRLLPGLEQAIGTMRAGEQTVAIIPPELAFGASGNPPVVGPSTYIVFEIERIR